jgi:hypothetical protein
MITKIVAISAIALAAIMGIGLAIQSTSASHFGGLIIERQAPG